MHLVGGRRLLDELDEVVLEDDLAGRHREIAADLEGRQIRLADPQQILGLIQVFGECPCL